jgi:hypothetical protein
MSDWYRNSIRVMREGDEAIKILKRIYDGEDPPMLEIGSLLKTRREREEESVLAKSTKEAERERRKKIGRANSGNFVVAPRVENGCDYSNVGLVLAVMGDYRLVWRYAGKHWGDQLVGYVGHPASLALHQDRERLGKDIHQGGRLTATLIMENQAAIDAVFGSGAAARISKLDKTVDFDKEES